MDQDKYIGRLLDNRYEIQEVIGVGGQAVVYKARCHRLNRLVAIKILKDELSRDEEFRRRFHAESQAVAMLSHPNIVSVYDVASTPVANYIVMELIDGISLKQYMEKKGVLNWKETLHFAIQIGKALEHAHSRGIVHRDIKPHNVMVLKNGSVKVTDFGIARVMSKANTLTKEALGSVHYISPEQAKGGRVDDRSDLYSLGVVMYEMITGRPPYDGESPVAVAIQHINGGAAMPSTLNPNIPGGLEQIIMKCMAHDPANRYDSATAMLYDMEEFRKDPIMIFDYKTPEFSGIDNIGERPNPVRRRSTAERVAAGSAAGASRGAINRNTGAQGRGVSRNTGSTGRPVSHNTDSAQTAAARKRREEAKKEEQRSRIATIAIVACSVVAIVAIAIFLITLMGGGFFAPKQDNKLEVPQMVGSFYNKQQTYEGFHVKLADVGYHDEYKENEIYDQTPKAGEKVNPDEATIYIYVSLGPEPKVLTMENLVDLTMDAAKKYLIGQGVEDSRIIVREEYNENVAEGKVIRTDPANGLTIQDSKAVILYISLGPEIEKVKMPNVVGWGFEDAKEILVDKGFDPMRITPVYVQSNEPENKVLGQSLERGVEVNINAEIILEVSLGPTEPPTTLPPETTVPPTTVPPTTVPPTTVPPTTVPPTTAAPAMPEMVEKKIIIKLNYVPTDSVHVELRQFGDLVTFKDVAAGTQVIEMLVSVCQNEEFDLVIDEIFVQSVFVDYTKDSPIEIIVG